MVIPTPTPSLPAATPPPAPRGATWIGTEEAAKRSGLDERSIRRLCGERWLAAGLARQVRGDGRRSRWEVREDADPRFARVLFAEQIPADLRSLTDVQRRTVFEREKLLKAWRAELSIGLAAGKTRGDVTADYLRRLKLAAGPAGKVPSRRTLELWESAYKVDGRAGLVDRRSAKESDGADGGDDDPFWQLLRDLYFNQRRRSLKECCLDAQEIATEQGIAPRSYYQCRRYIADLPASAKLLHREGVKAWQDRAGPYIQRDYATLSSNELWCSDHHRFDAWVNVDGKLVRPWLTAWQDLRSRMIVGWSIYVHDPNQDVILEALDAGFATYGLPTCVYLDNGKDFRSFALTGETRGQRFGKSDKRQAVLDDDQIAGLFAELQIDRQHSLPYNARAKPIERFFRTLKDQMVRRLPTFCGGKVAERPEDLQRHMGRAPTLAELRERFTAWLEAEYHARPHDGQGMNDRTPAEVYAACLATKRVPTAEQRAMLRWKWTPVQKVGRNGVRYRDISFGQYDPALTSRFGQDVRLRIDPADLSRVAVLTPDRKFIAVVMANQTLPLTGASEADLREANRRLRQARAVARDFIDARPKLGMSAVDHLHDIRAERARAEQAAREAAAAPSLRLVQSDNDPELAKLAEALKGKPAAEPAGPTKMELMKFLADRLGQEQTDDQPVEDPFEPFRALQEWNNQRRAEEQQLAEQDDSREAVG